MNKRIYEYPLLILPLGAFWVKSYASFLFLILVILGLKEYRLAHLLKREEKILIGCFILFFLSFFPGALLYGWSYNQTKVVFLEFHFLLFFPLYLLVNSLSSCLVNKYLQSITVAGLIISLMVGYESIFYGDFLRDWGNYGGQGVSMMVVFSFSASYIIAKWSIKERNFLWIGLSLLSLMCTVYIVFYSSVRGSILALLLVFFLIVLIDLKNIKQRIIFLTILLFLSFIAYSNSPITKNKVNIIPSQIYEYYENGLQTNSSIGQRIEMAYSVYLITKDNPLFGIGYKNYDKAVSKLKEKGLVSKNLIDTNHPHSIFSSTLYGKGLFGLCVLFFLFGYLIKTAYANRHFLDGQFLGLFVTIVIVTGLFDTYPLYRGIALKFFIVSIAILAASIFNRKYQKNGKYLP